MKGGCPMRSLGRLALASCLTMLVCNPARADIVEIRGEGYVNGEIVSQDDKEVQFKDNKGKLRVLSKKDVLYLEKEDKARAVKNKAADAWDALKKAPENIKKKTDALTGKMTGAVKPVDRSAANRKADALAKSMDQASEAAAALNKKNLAVSSEIRRQRQEAEGVASSASSQKKGRFASLSD